MHIDRTRQKTAQIKSGLPDVVGDGDDEDDADGGPGGHAAAQQVRPHLAPRSSRPLAVGQSPLMFLPRLKGFRRE